MHQNWVLYLDGQRIEGRHPHSSNPLKDRVWRMAVINGSKGKIADLTQI